MAYTVWPSNIPIPEIPLNGDIELPIQASALNNIGAYSTFRSKTRACLNASGVIKLILPSDFDDLFLPFYRDTLNDGLKKFTATWLTYFGYKGYVGKIINFRANLNGIQPNINIELDLIPDVQYSIITPSIPSPWPSKVNA